MTELATDRLDEDSKRILPIPDIPY